MLLMLSSQTGDSTQHSNVKVAAICIEDSVLLKQIAEGLFHKDVKLAGDCAEVLVKVAETHAHLVAPYVEQLLGSIEHPNSRVRWETMHALAWISPHVSMRLMKELDAIQARLFTDSSTIVKDYSILCLGNVAACGEAEARTIFPILVRCIDQLGEKFLSKTLAAMTGMTKVSPHVAIEALRYGHEYESHPKGSVQKAAKKLLKAAKS